MIFEHNPYININLKDNIIKCFESNAPDSIIVGGSYANSEENILSDNGTDYCLSDIDLVCIRDDGFSFEESQNIYKKMLFLSNSIDQNNPYFHIGLKLRSPSQLKREVDSLYFKELSECSYSIHGDDFLNYFSKKQKFGFFDVRFEEKNRILYQYALTRLWCNVLFFPLKLLNGEFREYRIWYNYFFARGALDFITWNLIRNNSWVNGYESRYNVWSNSRSKSASYSLNLKRCLDTKIGKSNVDYRFIFKDIINFSIEEINKINDKRDKNNHEFEFLISMNRFIQIHSEKDINLNAASVLSNASNQLTRIAPGFSEINSCLSNIEQWNSLRNSYSNFRFNRNKQDKIDHNIYTEHFLCLGS